MVGALTLAQAVDDPPRDATACRRACHRVVSRGRMRRDHLNGHDCDRVNAVLVAAGYNFSLLRRWSDELLRALRLIFCRAPSAIRFA
jgi:hypothetical protein